MKKLLLFVSVIAAVSLSSCSEDDPDPAPRQSTIKATINGVQKTFDYVTVTEEVYPDYTDLKVVGTTLNDLDDWLQFVVVDGMTGEFHPWFFAYYIDNVWYDRQPGFNLTVTENNGDVITGTFSGTVEHWDPNVEELITISDGEFTIYR